MMEVGLQIPLLITLALHSAIEDIPKRYQSS
jgi:hypothetical protein